MEYVIKTTNMEMMVITTTRMHGWFGHDILPTTVGVFLLFSFHQCPMRHEPKRREHKNSF